MWDDTLLDHPRTTAADIDVERVEIEAAKTIERLTAPVDGVLQRVLVSEGRGVRVRERLAVIAAPDDGPAEDADAAKGDHGVAEARLLALSHALDGQTDVAVAGLATKSRR